MLKDLSTVQTIEFCFIFPEKKKMSSTNVIAAKFARRFSTGTLQSFKQVRLLDWPIDDCALLFLI